MKRRQTLVAGAGAAMAWAIGGNPKSMATDADAGVACRWGNIDYVDLAIGQTHRYGEHQVTLAAVNGDQATIDVDGHQAVLPMARLHLPVVLGGVRVFVADTRPAVKLTADRRYPRVRALLGHDAVLGLSRPDRPLLDPNRFIFPIDRADGFHWSMEENSHQFAFISPERAHEGIDIDLHYARGYRVHALVAIEDVVVRWVERERTSPREACVLAESVSQPGIYYVYQHLNRNEVQVAPGAQLRRGGRIGYIWGDGIWGHLHFAVLGRGTAPDFSVRYQYVLNAFSPLYQLWHGDLELRSRRYTQGHWGFDRNKAAHGNRKYLNGYKPVLGYGFRIGDFCPADRVESGPERGPAALDTSARLRKILFAASTAAARNPRNHYEFQIDVEPGRYEIQVRVGDAELPTWQRLSINGRSLGVHPRPAGGFFWTPLRAVDARQGTLILRIDLRGDALAALSAISFRKVS